MKWEKGEEMSGARARDAELLLLTAWQENDASKNSWDYGLWFKPLI